MGDERAPLSERQVATALRTLSEQHAERVSERDRARAWARLQARSDAPVSAAPSAGGGRLAAMVGVLAVAAAGLLLLASQSDAQLSYEVSGASSHAGLIEARRGEATVSFSDRSSILAENQTRFSVDVVGKHAALTRLVSGKLHVRVQHNDDTSYRFLVGPYEVRVVGTEFDLAWEPEASGLHLAMSKGEVQVNAPGQPQRVLRAGQTLRLPPPQNAAKAARLAAAATEVAASSGAAAALLREPGAAAAATPEGARAAEPGGTPALSGAPVAGAGAGAGSSWDAAVAKGHFADVVREAEATGIDIVLATRGASDLKALAQASRYVGKPVLSLRAFSMLRDRFRSSDGGRQASFFIGRLQEEQGNRAEALRWLSTYVEEAPRGVYAAEASGRRLSLTERLRGRAAAVGLARDYLERFPKGAYAATARGILDRR